MVPFGLSGGMSAEEAAIQRKIYRSGCLVEEASRATSLIVSNEEMKDIMKIVKLLKESGLLIKEISKTIKNETKEQNFDQ